MCLVQSVTGKRLISPALRESPERGGVKSLLRGVKCSSLECGLCSPTGDSEAAAPAVAAVEKICHLVPWAFLKKTRNQIFFFTSDAKNFVSALVSPQKGKQNKQSNKQTNKKEMGKDRLCLRPHCLGFLGIFKILATDT